MKRRPVVAVAFLVIAASVGCKTEVAPQAAVDPAALPNQAPVVNSDAGRGPDAYPAYATRPFVRTVSPPPMPVEQYPAQQSSEQQYSAQPYSEPPTSGRFASRTEPRRRVVTRERPLSHSAAIVGGSAGVGAAVGALAGGGKGAGIGALAGGGGGFIYDRLTHKRQVVVEDRR
jgi:uncharacterized protein YcfJ